MIRHSGGPMTRPRFQYSIGPNISFLVLFVCYAFFDDTNVIHSASSTATPGERIIAEMQVVLDRWGGVLRATGGALAPSKSSLSAIDFRWNDYKWVYHAIHDMPGDILITGVDSERVIL